MEKSPPNKPLLINTILQNLKKNPQRIGLHFNNQEISNGQLFHKINDLSLKFTKIGIKTNTLVAVFLHRSPEALLCLLALWKIRAIYIPLDPEYPQERLENICLDINPDFIITEAELSKKTNTLPYRKILLQPITFIDTPEPLLNDSYTASVDDNVENDIAYILYTSGSSGIPKGVVISQQSLSSLFEGLIPLLGLTSQDVFLGISNFCFDISFFELIVPFLLGGRLILLDKNSYKDPELIITCIEDKCITVIQTTPSLWQLLNHLQWNKKQRKVKAISTGEALGVNVAKSILMQSEILWNLYGPTECTIWATGKKLNSKSWIDSSLPYVPIGSALPGYQVSVNGDEEKGELYISGNGLARGYHGKPELSAKHFITLKNEYGISENVYCSGDICSVNASKELCFHGRIDNQVKLNGYRIELEEIEARLEAHPSIKHALVCKKETGKNKVGILYAFIEHEKGMPNKTEENINNFLAAALANYMLPQRYLFLDKIALTINGKKDRNAIPELSQFSVKKKKQLNPRASSTSHCKEAVALIFCEVLDIPEIGLYDSFFDAGGNSMLAASLTMAINHRFGAKLSFKDILLTPPTVLSTSLLLQAQQVNSDKIF